MARRRTPTLIAKQNKVGVEELKSVTRRLPEITGRADNHDPRPLDQSSGERVTFAHGGINNGNGPIPDLRKYEGGGIFGPLPFDQLSRWASKARVAPRDLVSSDQENWMKAPMLSELGMDWLVEVTSERYYGPTTLGAINEFVQLGEVTPENFVINTCDGSRRKIQEITPYFPNHVEEGDGSVDQRPRRRACRSSSKNGFAIWSAAWERSGALCRTRNTLPRTGTTLPGIADGFARTTVAHPKLGWGEL